MAQVRHSSLGIDEVAEEAAGAAQLRRQRRDQRRADAGGDDRRPAGTGVAASTSALAARISRICRSAMAPAAVAPVVQSCIRAVAAEAAGKAREALLERRAAAVRGPVLVGVLGQLAENAAHVRHGGEVAGGEPLRAVLQAGLMRDGADVGAREAGIDELARRKTLAVGEPARARAPRRRRE